jgi:hypothetical protein
MLNIVNEVKHLACVFGMSTTTETEGPYLEDQYYMARVTTLHKIIEFA